MTESTQPIARPFADMHDSGLLWWINRQLHTRGFALGLHKTADGTVTGWSLHGDGLEVWSYLSDVDEDRLFTAFEATLREQAQQAARARFADEVNDHRMQRAMKPVAEVLAEFADDPDKTVDLPDLPPHTRIAVPITPSLPVGGTENDNADAVLPDLQEADPQRQ